jgi:type IV secretion system protein VirB10
VPPSSGAAGAPPPAAPKLSGGKIGIAASQGKIFTTLGMLAIGIGFVVYVIFGGDDDKKASEEIIQKVPNKTANIAPPPDLPDETPPPPAVPFDFNTASPPPPEIDFEPEAPVSEEVNKSLMERLKSPMTVFGGKGVSAAFGSGATQEEQDNNGFLSSQDGNNSFARRSMEATSAPTVVSKTIKNMQVTIAQGKIIHAVLETAVNTQLPGYVRAIVSRDAYSEHGRNILIPKGSRLIGSYNTSLVNGQNRVFIMWNRVIRPDGIDVMINSPAVDSLGRAGLHGYIDTRFGQMLYAATLSSLIGVGVAVLAEEVGNGEQVQVQQTTGNPFGGTSTTGGSSQQAAMQAAGNISNVGTDVAQKILDLRPRITIDQGTQVEIFVNNDLIFPDELANSSMMIP